MTCCGSLLVFAVAGRALPEPAAIFSDLNGEDWASDHRHWVGVLVAASIGFVAATSGTRLRRGARRRLCP